MSATDRCSPPKPLIAVRCRTAIARPSGLPAESPKGAPRLTIEQGHDFAIRAIIADSVDVPSERRKVRRQRDEATQGQCRVA
jgi:hypothetical protein